MDPVRPEAADDGASVHRHRRLRRVQIGMAVFALCIGLVSFANVAGNPRFDTYRTLDVLRLMTAGAGFGVALVLTIQFCKRSGPHAGASQDRQRV